MIVRLLLALLVLLMLPAAAGAEVLEELEIPTRDGDTVHVELARPDGDAKVPVILTYSPYNTLGATPATNLASGSPWVGKGYARAYADVIGTRNSTGCWDYGGPREQRSGVDLVEALSRQPWANGKVAVQGVSYDGTTANMIGAQGAVPGLAAIVPVAAISRWYGYAYQDGVRFAGNTEEPTDEGLDTPFGFDFGFGRTPPDRPADAQAILDRLKPCDSVDHTEHAYSTTPDYDDFWLARDYRKDAAKFRVPTFIVHGWQDYNVKVAEGVDLYSQIPVDDPATAKVEGVPFKLLHLHQAPHADGAGDDYDVRLEAFFEHTLKGVDNGIEREPAVRTQTRTGRDAGDFLRTTSFPPPGTGTVALRLGRADGAGVLSADAGGDPASLSDAGATTEETAIQSLDSETSWLAYRSAPLAADERMIGTPLLRLRVASSTAAGQVSPTLLDIAPDGGIVPISRGHLDLRYRDGLAKAKPLAPGTPYDVTVRFAPQDQTLPAGHQIGLLVAGSNTAWALPAADGPRTLTITHGPPSRLELPILGAAPPAPAVVAARLTAKLRRAGVRRVRISGLATASARVRVAVLAGRRTIARRTVTASPTGSYTAVLRTGSARRVRARVTAAGLSRRTSAVRPRRH